MLAETSRWERLLVLAPAIVIGVGLVAAVFVLLGRAFADSIREVKHKRLLWIGAAVFVGGIVVLTYLGVNLPKE
jgi:hypothetical protein